MLGRPSDVRESRFLTIIMWWIMLWLWWQQSIKMYVISLVVNVSIFIMYMVSFRRVLGCFIYVRNVCYVTSSGNEVLIPQVGTYIINQMQYSVSLILIVNTPHDTSKIPSWMGYRGRSKTWSGKFRGLKWLFWGTRRHPIKELLKLTPTKYTSKWGIG